MITEESSVSSSNRWKYAFIGILFIFILTTSFFKFVFLNFQNNFEKIETSLNEQGNLIQDLQNHLHENPKITQLREILLQYNNDHRSERLTLVKDQ